MLTRRTPLRATKPMRRAKRLSAGKPLERGTKLVSLNSRRRRRLHALQFGRQAELCRQSMCCVCGSWPSDAHHEISRGAGGRDGDTIPLCRSCHTARHVEGRRSFWKRREINPEDILAYFRKAVAT